MARDTSDDPVAEVNERELENLLYARHVEVESYKDLELQRGTPIPAMFNQFYKFVQNPSTVSVETFKRMVDTDDTVSSGVDFLTTCLAARMGRYEHPSDEITEFVNKALAEIDGGFFGVQKELLAAVWAGFVCAEKVWANTPMGFVPKKIVALPPTSCLFEVERTGELTPDGILQYQRNYNPAFFQSGSNFTFGFSMSSAPTTQLPSPDPFAKLGDFPYPVRTANMYSYLAIRIPRAKCIHLAFSSHGAFGNPYGRSKLRAGYKWWVCKDAFIQMLSIALDRKGTPLTVVFADPSTTLIDGSRVDETANQRGKSVGIRADVAAYKAFKNVHNDSVIILPGKKDQIYGIETISQQSNANDFIEAIRFCDRGLMRTMLIPSLIFTSGDGAGSFALGQEHAKTFDKICDGMNEPMKSALLNQLVKDIIAYNFPRSAWEKDGLGDFGKRELSQDEIDKEMDTVEKAVNTGAIDMNDLGDLNKVRDKIGFDPRTTPIPRPDPMGGFGAGDEVQGNEPEIPAEGDK